MGKEAVGAYIRALREANRLGQQVFAASLDTSKSLLDLIEKGKIDTRGSLLIHMLLQLHGSPADLVELMANPDATPEDGRQLAERWVQIQREQHVDTRHPQQWEYAFYKITALGMVAVHTTDLGHTDWYYVGKTINDLGREGWELVSVGTWEKGEALAVFKRPSP